ncbi:MAG: 3-deoxy-manno-octulosonate cytidylyltransferase [Nitrospirae bacterium]|nr:3-deoxy-manno-octulosonate cytidylyltransferase [Candidatus Troglogloeales bacterium]MBI3598779.1 3-deoxy-manno-octulosonate cytidylyltransferase [Candidatus Troglogloeales bacterium]
MNTLIVIPARFQSARFPGKPLALLQGKPMIWHVWSRATQIKMADKVIVATEDDRIAKTVSEFGGEAVITAATHRTGSDRVAEVAALYPAQLIVNLQGDLPLFRPSVLDRLIKEGGQRIISQGADLVTLSAKIDKEEDIFSPNTVKLVRNDRGDILYFSRSPIPHIERGTSPTCLSGFFKHYGVYLYQREFLLKMANCPEGDLERMERLEQLRVLERGGRVWAMEINCEEAKGFCEVNTPEDLILGEKMVGDHDSK